MSDGDGLPKGWARAQIADLVELKNGYAFKPSDWQEEGLPIIRIQNLNNSAAVFNHYPGSLPDRFRIKNGDLLFAWSGTPGTSFGAHIWRGEDAWLNQHIFRVDFDSRFLDQRFLQRAINYNLDDYIFQAHGGAGLAHITKGKFESSELLIAPLKEQHRIVSKIDELFSDLDAAVAALTRAKAKLKRYRAAVLKAAVEGKLTAAWRKKNRPKESGQQLLDRILRERRCKWEEEQLAAYDKAGKKPPANWKEKYKEPSGPDDASLSALPEGWCWATVEQVSEVQGGIQKQPKRAPARNAYPFLRVANVYRNRLDLSEIHQIELFGDELARLRLASGDLLVVEGNGSITEIGRSALWLGEVKDCVHQNHIIRVRFLAGSPKYLNGYWNSPFGNNRVMQVAASTSGLYTLSVTKVCSLPIPLPPLVEQEKIAEEVERTLSVVQESESQITADLKRSARLRQSILKRAFEGELVPQDPKDEPAGILLERIKATKADANGKAKPRKTR